MSLIANDSAWAGPAVSESPATAATSSKERRQVRDMPSANHSLSAAQVAAASRFE